MQYTEIVERHHVAGVQSQVQLKIRIADYMGKSPIGSINGFYQLGCDVKRTQQRMVISNLEYIPLKIKGNYRRLILNVGGLVLESEIQRRRGE